TIEMRAQMVPDVAITQGAGIRRVSEQLDSCLLEYWLFVGKRAGFLVLTRELSSLNFAGLDIRLVECINSDDRAGNGRRNLPAKELLAKIVSVAYRNSDDGMASSLKCRDLLVLHRIRCWVEP